MPRISVTEVSSPDELDLVMEIWAAANQTRRRPAGPLRTERVREKVAEGQLVLLAHYGDRPAGMALAETFHDGEYADPDTGHISMISVDPAIWGSGVGGRLIRHLQQRWSRLSVWVRPDNRRAERLYLACGFVDVDNVSHLQDGEEIRQLVWQRPTKASP
ncbi:GNAT family N-acetyltransferase [Nocardioides sp. Kera G14]|uniref:GNAT family N-acetyltransferase n=1 Tax=Nocardioides sp. Kera G14 TaxID=2884264 RepID=UPI001D11494E|nr:GNAT family N-acetyltransferase [Nocardioides sp. Kera G14]UDY22509.1 GNAT family N-acetyltransferase [Nocardioides sp. Kera G14]